jgi:flavin reductase (DIM6/NTAB) family NADH-FMN oxidoreductase RutF
METMSWSCNVSHRPHHVMMKVPRPKSSAHSASVRYLAGRNFQ